MYLEKMADLLEIIMRHFETLGKNAESREELIHFLSEYAGVKKGYALQWLRWAVDLHLLTYVNVDTEKYLRINGNALKFIETYQDNSVKWTE